MEWKLADDKKAVYESMLKSAQDIEATIGSTEYRISRLIKLREDIDVSLKKWWEEILVEMKLDPGIDYMITKEGTVKSLTEPKTPTPSTVGSNATELI